MKIKTFCGRLVAFSFVSFFCVGITGCDSDGFSEQQLSADIVSDESEELSDKFAIDNQDVEGAELEINDSLDQFASATPTTVDQSEVPKGILAQRHLDPGLTPREPEEPQFCTERWTKTEGKNGAVLWESFNTCTGKKTSSHACDATGKCTSVYY